MSAGTKTMATKKVNILDQAKTGSVFQGNVTLYNVILPRSLNLSFLSLNLQKLQLKILDNKQVLE